MNDNIKIVARISKATNRIELFYYDKNELVCVDKNEGHTTADYGYYTHKTIKVPNERIKEANEFISSYIGADTFFTQSQKLK